MFQFILSLNYFYKYDETQEGGCKSPPSLVPNLLAVVMIFKIKLRFSPPPSHPPQVGQNKWYLNRWNSKGSLTARANWALFTFFWQPDRIKLPALQPCCNRRKVLDWRDFLLSPCNLIAPDYLFIFAFATAQFTLILISFDSISAFLCLLRCVYSVWLFVVCGWLVRKRRERVFLSNASRKKDHFIFLSVFKYGFIGSKVEFCHCASMQSAHK